ncbi:hypothetical protein K458DRAFT_392597 [Lentithecium fluviatile CBS 122367]|uniref:Uncharacterized protein n=1 Tax=Lentithecium fluviatile CBS 122367 TaxID=1168545 RepID=A0A6G1IRQ6_9PLEO|nr:hypothetical protein K458DRAFT_392597 [Lentithecium fluviatile CBS 122367]
MKNDAYRIWEDARHDFEIHPNGYSEALEESFGKIWFQISKGVTEELRNAENEYYALKRAYRTLVEKRNPFRKRKRILDWIDKNDKEGTPSTEKRQCKSKSIQRSEGQEVKGGGEAAVPTLGQTVDSIMKANTNDVSASGSKESWAVRPSFDRLDLMVPFYKGERRREIDQYNERHQRSK